MPQVDVKFIEKDVERQRSIAEEALEEAERLGAQIEQMGNDTAAKATLSSIRVKLIQMADRLTANAETTAVSGTDFLNAVAKRI